MLIDDVKTELDKHKERNIAVLFGIEGHICIQQTCLDLLEGGYEVMILADGISSQRELDRTVGLKVFEIILFNLIA